MNKTEFTREIKRMAGELKSIASAPGPSTLWVVAADSAEYGVVYLYQYAAARQHEVEQKVLAGAQRENFVGTMEERLAFLGWRIVQMAAIEMPKSAAPNTEHLTPKPGAYGPLDRWNAAMHMVFSYGGVNEPHHKQWLLDQVIRLMEGAQYEQWVRDYNEYREGDGDGKACGPWDVGTPP